MITDSQFFSILLFAVLSVAIISGCSSENSDGNPPSSSSLQDSTARVATIEGKLSGTEAVRYDAEQDVYFISNFNGSAGKADSNGFITKATAQGAIDSLRFMTGTDEAPLHSPRGMYITGDTLYVADLMGVHAFNKKNGNHLLFTDFSSFNPGFLNDVAVTSDGSVFITDTGQSRVYKMNGQDVSVAIDSMAYPPNGITWQAQNRQLVIAPWEGGRSFRSLSADSSSTSVFLRITSGGNFDGIEPYKNSFLVASQKDSMIYRISNEQPGEIPLIKTAPKPADIALDTKRSRIAVPYINLNRVDIWEIDP